LNPTIKGEVSRRKREEENKRNGGEERKERKKKRETLAKVQEIQSSRISKLEFKFRLGGFRDKKKDRQQHQPTSIKDFKLGKYIFKL